jgi:hypothetical protein
VRVLTPGAPDELFGSGANELTLLLTRGRHYEPVSAREPTADSLVSAEFARASRVVVVLRWRACAQSAEMLTLQAIQMVQQQLMVRACVRLSRHLRTTRALSSGARTVSR